MNPIYRNLLIAAVLIGIGFGAGWNWRDSDYQKLRADTAKESALQATALADETTKRVDAEHKLSDANDKLATANQRINDYVSSQVTKFRGDVRSGTVRLSVPTRSCAPATNADPTTASQPATEARAELLPEFADRLIDRAARCDVEVRERNEVIDRYNNAREALVRLQNQ